MVTVGIVFLRLCNPLYLFYIQCSISIYSFRLFLWGLFKYTLLLRSSEAPSTQHGYCVGVSRRSATCNLPKVPTWGLERNSNPRPFGRKASNLPMNHHAPTIGKRSCLYAVQCNCMPTNV